MQNLQLPSIKTEWQKKTIGASTYKPHSAIGVILILILKIKMLKLYYPDLVKQTQPVMITIFIGLL
jgi:hypothetical protein